MAAARVGDLILIATTPEDLHPLIDTADGRTPAITTLPEFTAVRDALPADFLMFAFSNSVDTSDADFGPFAMFADQFSTDVVYGIDDRRGGARVPHGDRHHGGRKAKRCRPARTTTNPSC